MSRSILVGKIVEDETVGSELASTVVAELTDILDQAERPEPSKDLEIDYWYYSVPLAGVRYYGFPEHSSAE